MAAMSDPINAPSQRRLHQWSIQRGLGANPGQLASSASLPRVTPTRRTQRTISLNYPIHSFADEVIDPPTLYLRGKPDAAVLSKLVGAGDGAMRLSVWDKTVNQQPLDLQRDTSYEKDYSKPVSVRFPPIFGRLNRNAL